jgi:PAS domain S-box-containing protein
MGPHSERTARLERQLAAAQQLTHIGSWEWDLATSAVTWSDELYRIYGLEPQSCEITFEVFLSRVHPEDRDRIHGEVRSALERGGRFAYPERIVRPDGSVRELDTVGEVKRDAGGRPVRLLGTCRDVTAERRASRLRAAEQRLLEMIASGSELGPVLDRLALLIEEQAPETIASVLLLDSSGTRVRTGAAPNLPPEYSAAIDGLPIGPAAGSCGTAAYTNRPVFVADIESDPRWADYREAALRHGLRACWSTPIAHDGKVLGTFALYYRQPRSPAPEEIDLIARATHIAGIAIQRAQLDEQLRALSAHIESVREEERTGVAREIHDELGQALTALTMDIAWMRRRTPPGGEPAAKLDEMAELTDALIASVRRISADLRPGVLDDLGLVAAIEWQAQEFERRTGTPCVVQSDVGERRFERDVSTAVFRIFQEALTNVTRHAGATRVEARFEYERDRLRLRVHDNGRGIGPVAASSRSSLGLLGIRERARRLGGVVEVGNAPEGGTLVVLELPALEGSRR